MICEIFLVKKQANECYNGDDDDNLSKEEDENLKFINFNIRNKILN